MSLVVGRIIDNNIFIESDTRITDIKEVPSEPLSGCLKTIILHPFICMSFAGNIYYAELAIKDSIKYIKENKIFNPNDIITILYNYNLLSIEESDNDESRETDFVLAITDFKIPILTKIAEGKVECNVNSFWLGDKIAFNYYQEQFHLLRDKEESILNCMRNSFQLVIEKDSIETVGDFQISVHTDNKLIENHIMFSYTQKIKLDIHHKEPIKIEKANKWYAFPLGKAEDGSYGISYFTSLSPNYHGVAIHFICGMFGVLFCPQISIDPIVIHKVNSVDFIKRIKGEYNIPMQGVAKIDDNTMQLIRT